MTFFLLFCVALGCLIVGGGWLLAQALMPLESPAQIGRRVGQEAAERYLRSDELRQKIDDAIAVELRKPEYRAFWFLKGIQARLREEDKTLDPKRALDLAREAYRQFLADNEIEFGAPGWDWSDAGARTIAEEYEIQYWEQAA